MPYVSEDQKCLWPAYCLLQAVTASGTQNSVLPKIYKKQINMSMLVASILSGFFFSFCQPLPQTAVSSESIT